MHKDLPHPLKWLQCISLYGCIINTSDGYLGCIPFFHINNAIINIFVHLFLLPFPIINFLEVELLVQKECMFLILIHSASLPSKKAVAIYAFMYTA